MYRLNSKSGELNNIYGRNSIDSFFLNLVFAFLYSCIFLSRLNELQEAHIMVFQTMLSCVMLLYLTRKLRGNVVYTRFKKIILMILIFMGLNSIIIGNVEVKMMIDAVINMPCLVLLLYYLKLNKWITLGLYLGVLIYIIHSVFVVGNDFSNVTVNGYNYISYHLMLYSIPFFLYCNNNQKMVNLLMPLSCFVLAALATGRGGILCTGVILIYSFYRAFKGNRAQGARKQKIIICLCVVGAIYWGVGVYMEYSEYIEIAMSRFEDHGMESSGRSIGWAQYFLSCLNPFYFIWGAPIDTMPYVKNHLLGSLHNSYLTLHAREGIYGIVVICMMVKGVIRVYGLRYHNIFILLLMLMQKGFTDADVAGNMVGGDVYVYLLILFYLETKNQSSKESTFICQNESCIKDDKLINQV